MIFIKRKSAVKPETGKIVDSLNVVDKSKNTYSARLIDEKIANSGGSGGTGGTSAFNNLVPIGCAIRPTSNGWILIQDTGHEPINVTGISITSDNKLKITHTPNATKVGALTITPDETFLKQGFFAGASVGTDYSIITIIRNLTLSGYIRYNGSGWTINATYSNLIKNVKWDDVYSRLDIEFNTGLSTPPSGWNVVTRQETYKACASIVNNNTITIEIFDISGNKVTDKSKYDFLSVQCFYDYEVNPNSLVSNPIDGANFWISGYAWE